MALNALTLAVSTGVQGYPFRAALSGRTAGSDVTLGADTTTQGGGVLNGVLDHPALPFEGANTFVVIERAPSGETRTTRIEVNGISRRGAFAAGDASLSNGRTAVSRRVIGTRQVDGSLVWTVAVTDDLGAEIVTPLGGAPDVTPPQYNGSTTPSGTENQQTLYTATFNEPVRITSITVPGGTPALTAVNGMVLGQAFVIQRADSANLDYEDRASWPHTLNFVDAAGNPATQAITAAVLDEDEIPDLNATTLPPQTNATRSTGYTPSYTVAGLGTGVSVPVTVGVAWTRTRSGTTIAGVNGTTKVQNGDVIASASPVQSAATYSADVNTTFTVGGTTYVWILRTQADPANNAPNAPVLTRTSSAGANPILFSIAIDSTIGVGDFWYLEVAGNAAFTQPLSGESAIRTESRLITLDDFNPGGALFSALTATPGGPIYVRLYAEHDGAPPIRSAASNVLNDTLAGVASAILADTNGTNKNTYVDVDTTKRIASAVPYTGGRSLVRSVPVITGKNHYEVTIPSLLVEVYFGIVDAAVALGPNVNPNPGYDAAGLMVYRYPGATNVSIDYNGNGIGVNSMPVWAANEKWSLEYDTASKLVEIKLKQGATVTPVLSATLTSFIPTNTTAFVGAKTGNGTTNDTISFNSGIDAFAITPTSGYGYWAHG